jgi:valyl-tRNA synthetase
MPFVTEAIWAGLPRLADDPELLIVARWPSAGQRDEAVARDFGRVIDAIVAIRNARATAGVAAGAWLETHVAATRDLYPTLEALAPAIGRLARARPLTLHRRDADLPRPEGALEVVLPGGEIEASVFAAPADDTRAVDRARLEKELGEAEAHLAASRARLANAAFTERAPAAVVDGARAREAELVAQVDRLRARLAG